MTAPTEPATPNRKRARDPSPRLSRAQLADILGGVADGVIVQTPKGRWLFANQAAAVLIGYPTTEALLNASVVEVVARFDLVDASGNPLGLADLPARTALRGKPSLETLIGFRTVPAQPSAQASSAEPSSAEPSSAQSETERAGDPPAPAVDPRATDHHAAEPPTIRWSIVRAHPVFTPTGRVKFVVSTFRDVSEIMRTTQALQASEERYRRLVDLLPDAVAVHHAGRISFVNPAALALMGVRASEALLGRRVLELVHPDFHALASQRMQSLAVGQVAPWTEQQMVRPDGSVVDVEVAATPLHDAEAGSVLVVVRDITERKRQAARLQQSRDELAEARDELERMVLARTAQLQRALMQVEQQLAERAEMDKALRESELQFRSVAESAGEAIIIADGAGRIVYWNSGAARCFGYSAAEMRDQPLSSLMPQRYRDQHVQGMARFHASGHGTLLGRPLSLHGLRKDGGEFPLELSLASWQSGDTLYVSGIIRDTTERQRNEERLEAARQQLRDLTAHLQTAREEERAAIARELHDELAQILIVAKLEIGRLSKEAQRLDASPARLQSALEELAATIDESVQSIRAIVSELRPPMLDNLGLEAAMDWQVQQFQQRSGISATFVAQARGLAWHADRSLAMFRILQEALTNVLRHARATQVDVSLRIEGDQLCLEVRDNGVGLDGANLHKANHFGVIGMRERITLLGGDVTFRPAPEHGTIVVVRAPLAAPAAPAAPSPTSADLPAAAPPSRASADVPAATLPSPASADVPAATPPSSAADLSADGTPAALP